jgi:hypothetical protein
MRAELSSGAVPLVLTGAREKNVRDFLSAAHILYLLNRNRRAKKDMTLGIILLFFEAGNSESSQELKFRTQLHV